MDVVFEMPRIPKAFLPSKLGFQDDRREGLDGTVMKNLLLAFAGHRHHSKCAGICASKLQRH